MQYVKHMLECNQTWCGFSGVVKRVELGLMFLPVMTDQINSSQSHFKVVCSPVADVCSCPGRDTHTGPDTCITQLHLKEGDMSQLICINSYRNTP